MTQYIENFIPVVQSDGLNTQKAVSFGSTLAVTGVATFTAAPVFTAAPTGPVKQNVITAAATLTAAQSGSLCIMSDLTGTLYTLPAASVGLNFTFFVSVTNTSGAHKVITPASVFLVGAIDYGVLDTTPAANPGPKFTSADGTTIRSISMNGTTTGGLFGTAFTVVCISSTQWAIQGQVIASGTISTPFATS